jgi:hypothetical protein
MRFISGLLLRPAISGIVNEVRLVIRTYLNWKEGVRTHLERDAF